MIGLAPDRSAFFLIELFKRNGASRFIGAPFLFEYGASMDIDAQVIVGY